MIQRFVLDASAGVDLLLSTPTGAQLRPALPVGAEEWVPELYFAEVAAALRRLELSRKITTERASLALDRLFASPARRAQVKPLVPAAWRFRHNITLSDALYVVLAHELRAPLVTTDKRLARSPGLPVEVIAPQ